MDNVELTGGQAIEQLNTHIKDACFILKTEEQKTTTIDTVTGEIKTGDWVIISANGSGFMDNPVKIMGQIIIHGNDEHFKEDIVSLYGVNIFFGVRYSKITKLSKEQIKILGLES